MGTLTITTQPDTTKATANISGTTLTVTPVAAGTTSLVLTEANGGKTATIPINVLETSITADPTSVTANIGDGNQTVTLGGTNAGTFDIVTQPNSAVATVSISGNTLTITPVAKGNTNVTVKELNGNKQTTIDITIDNKVTAPSVPTTDYGAIVNEYICSSAGVNQWRIFYADDRNIYLISDNYIPYRNVPSSSKGTRPEFNFYADDAVGFGNVYLDYAGSSSITDERIKALNNDFFTKGYSSTEVNMRCVSYILDINAWKGFAGENAEYAVGGPSIEMLMASYSKKYRVDYRAQAIHSNGYQISIDGGNNWKDKLDSLNANDRTYVVNNEFGYWIASPAYQGLGGSLFQIDESRSYREWKFWWHSRIPTDSLPKI